MPQNFKSKVMKTKIIHLLVMHWILLTGMSMLSTACSNSNLDEPLYSNSESIQKTRSGFNETKTLSQEEAVAYAVEKLGYDKQSVPAYTVDHVTTNNIYRPISMLSDTLAYVVNFSDNSGYAVIANDTRFYPILAYAKAGFLKVADGKIDHPFLGNIENYFYKKYQTLSEETSTPYNCGNHNHCLMRERIETSVHDGDPFNHDVDKENPGCKAGTGAASGAIIMSYTLEEIIYKNCNYNFPSINYCLLQGPGYTPPVIVETKSIFPPNHGNIPTYFQHSYSGSVSAMSRLMCDLGKSMKTTYTKESSDITPENAYSALKSAGCVVSDFYREYDVQNIWSLVYNEYFVFMSAQNTKTGKKINFIIDGGESIYYTHPETTEWFSASLYIPDKNIGTRSNVILDLFNQSDYKTIGFFGVKENFTNN